MPDTKLADSSPPPTGPEKEQSSSTDAPKNPQLEDLKPEATPVQTVAELVPQPSTSAPQPKDRSELLARAHTFLNSPQVRNQDLSAKRAFLVEKGLNEPEIENLLRILPLQPPSIPPRTYPQLPPSNLPILLLGIVRLFTWLAGGSAIIVLLYHRLLLPRISATSLARHSIKSHQLSLLRELTTSLASLKKTQSESLSVLPRADPWKEIQKYAKCSSVSEVIAIAREGDKEVDFRTLPPVSVLRCGLRELGQNATTENLYKFLEEKIPWLLTEEGSEYEQQLWDTLSTCPLFGKANISSSASAPPPEAPESASPTLWEYLPPAPVIPPPLIKSLDALSNELPKDTKDKKSPFQHTLQAMSDFTGYLSTQVYLPYRPAPASAGISSPSVQTSVEEELRREIRALKGLVLNRRSFMPSIPKAGMAAPTRTIP